MPRKPSTSKPVGGGGARHPASLANLQRGGGQAFEPTNAVARRHGGYAAVAVERLDARARRIYDALSDDAPLRGPDGGLPAQDAGVVRLLAECLCRLDDVTEHLAHAGWLDQRTGDPRLGVLDLERRLRGEAAGYMDRLGLSPRARAALGLDLARTAQSMDAATALSAARGESDPERRRALLRQAGIDWEGE